MPQSESEKLEQLKTVTVPSSNLQYVEAVVAVVAFVLATIVAITVSRPIQDNTILIGLVVGFAAPTLLSLLALMKAQETHLSVNSRLDAFMTTAREASYAQGILEGRTTGRASADERTDALSKSSSPTPPSVVPT